MAGTTVQQMREFVEYAPATRPTARDLLGVWLADDHFVCAGCVGRATARGCPPRGATSAWKGEPFGTCQVCGQ